MPWASADDVVTITGREATTESLAAAQVIVEIFSGTSDYASDQGLIATRNLRMLKNAVAFQAIWLDSHPDVMDAMDVEGVSQDGLNAQYANANAHLLAPLANRCIERLSWRRQIMVGRSRAARIRADRGARDSAAADDQYWWEPLPFGETP